MTCAGLLHEARVTVDTGLLERAAFPTPILSVALVLSLVGVALAIRSAPGGHRAWSLFTLLAPIAALLAWLALQLRTELSFPCIFEPARTGARLVAIAAGVGALAFLQLCVTITLRAWKRELRVLWPLVLLTTALAISGSIGWHKATLLREFERRSSVAMPVPNIRPQSPEAHVARTLTHKPEVEAAGQSVGLFFPSRVRLSDEDRRRWNIDTITLTPKVEGVNTVPIHLEQDLVSVDAELEVRGVRDEGPAWFPLAKGNRWEFVAVRGRGGALEKLRSGIERGKKPIPEPSVTLEVTGEGGRDGFHTFELTETRKDAEPIVRELVRRDGELFSKGARVAWLASGRCQVQLLDPSWCNCVEDRVTDCRVVSGDLGETFLRLFLGAVTLGITELNGMGDLGVGNEAGLLMTRWTVAGEPRSLLKAKPGRGQ